MDTIQYQKEIAKLERELADINVDKSNNFTPKQKVSLGKYKNYFLVFLGTFLALYIIKPKFVLSVTKINDKCIILVNKKKFFLVWIAISLLVLFFLHIRSNKKTS
jgi:hypothetical protein